MVNPDMDLEAVYRAARQVGDELLHLLEQGTADDLPAELEVLLAERERLSTLAEERVAAGERSDAALLALKALISQQERLEAALSGHMAVIDGQLQAALRSKRVVGATGRLLGPRVRPGGLDTYR